MILTLLKTICDSYMYIVWIIIGLVCLLCEVGTPGLLFFLSLAGGTLFAALSAWLGCSLVLQGFIWTAWTIILFFVMNFFIKKFQSIQKTNAYGLIGQEGLVVTTVGQHHSGRVKIRGEEWVAIAKHNHIINKNTAVTIVGISGNKLIIIERK